MKGRAQLESGRSGEHYFAHMGLYDLFIFSEVFSFEVIRWGGGIARSGPTWGEKKTYSSDLYRHAPLARTINKRNTKEV